MAGERAATEVMHLKEGRERFRFGTSRLNKPTTSVIPFIPTFTEKVTQLIKIWGKKKKKSSLLWSPKQLFSFVFPPLVTV